MIPTYQTAPFERLEFLADSPAVGKIVQVRQAVTEKALDELRAHHFPRRRGNAPRRREASRSHLHPVTPAVALVLDKALCKAAYCGRTQPDQHLTWIISEALEVAPNALFPCGRRQRIMFPGEMVESNRNPALPGEPFMRPVRL